MKLEWEQTESGGAFGSDKSEELVARVTTLRDGHVLWQANKSNVYEPQYAGIIPAGPDALAAAKAAAEACLTPERDPLDVEAERLGVHFASGNATFEVIGPAGAIAYQNVTNTKLLMIRLPELGDTPTNRKVALSVVAVLLGKDQPETTAPHPVPPVEMDTMNFTGVSPQQPVQDDAEAFAERVVALSADKTVVGIGQCSGFFSRAAGSGDMLQEVADARRGIAAALRPEIERWKREARREERERIADWLCNRGWTVASDYVRADAAKGAT